LFYLVPFLTKKIKNNKFLLGEKGLSRKYLSKSSFVWVKRIFILVFERCTQKINSSASLIAAALKKGATVKAIRAMYHSRNVSLA
jgi:acyl-[acyl carrier protein]--UDP-N-acetylglucosamine O-acyltransferase